MHEPQRAHEILARAIAALEAVTGLRASTRPAPRTAAAPDALLDIAVEGRKVRFAAEIRTVDRFQTLGAIKAREGAAPYRPLLVAPYISEATAERCRALHLPFIDASGNAFLEAPGLFVYVTGRPRPMQPRATPAFRALTPAGLKIIFALLIHPELATASYRDISKLAGVALGTVGQVLADLEERGHLAPERPGPRRLLARERLQDEWVTHYPIKLRPKLNPRRFSAPDRDWWTSLDLVGYRAFWGGEVAAQKLSGYLKPERITLYVDGKPDQLILANRLRPHDNGEVELLNVFWETGEMRHGNDVAPPLLVYADLMASADPRSIETAKLIHDHHLAQARRSG